MSIKIDRTVDAKRPPKVTPLKEEVSIEVEAIEVDQNHQKTTTGPETQTDWTSWSSDPKTFASQARAMRGKTWPPIDDPFKAQVLEKQYRTLEANQRSCAGHEFTVPSPHLYNHLWLWDSAFHAQAMAWHNPQHAMKELRAVFAFQREDGFVPHEGYFEGDAMKVKPQDVELFARILSAHPGEFTTAEQQTLGSTFWTTPNRSDVTQPPVIAQAVEEVFKATGDRAFVQEMLPKLDAYYDYLQRTRDFDGDGLVSIIHQWESGWDHSQRWDELNGVEDGDTKEIIGTKKMNAFMHHKKLGWDPKKIHELDRFTAKPVDFNVLYATNMRSLARMHAALGESEQAKKYLDRVETTKKAIFTKMWDGDKYTDLLGKDARPSSVKSAAMFYPMLLDGEPHHATLIQQHLANPAEFNTKYGIPTTSIDNPRFDGDDYWRGNVWLNVNTFVWRGLQKVIARAPDLVQAKEMADKIERSSFQLLAASSSNEYYNPLNGNGGGPEDFGWNVMVYQMAKEPIGR